MSRFCYTLHCDSGMRFKGNQGIDFFYLISGGSEFKIVWDGCRSPRRSYDSFSQAVTRQVYEDSMEPVRV